MAENDLERLLAEMDPGKRAFLKTLIAGGAFAVPTLASFSVTDLSLAEAASGPTTSTVTVTTTT